MNVEESYDILMAEEADKLLDEDKVIQNALEIVQQNGIVFLDEVDKIAVQNNAGRGEVSREGVQRDLLPLIEGTTVNTNTAPLKQTIFYSLPVVHFTMPNLLTCWPNFKGACPSV